MEIPLLDVPSNRSQVRKYFSYHQYYVQIFMIHLVVHNSFTAKNYFIFLPYS